MAIQLPEVKRIEPDQTSSVGRIQANVPNPQRDLAEGQAGIDSVAGQAIKYRNQQADQTANSIATNQENEAAQRFKLIMEGDPERGIIGAKYSKDNPDLVHADVDRKMQDTLKELSSAPDGQEWSTETQNLVNIRLNRKAEELRLQQLTEYGAQKMKFDDNGTETSVKLNQQAMPDSSTHIDPESIARGDRSTLGPIETNLNSLRQARIEQGIRYGADHENENGQDHYRAADGTLKAVDLSPSTKLAILQDRSTGIHDTIDNLIKTGATDPQALAKAKVLMDQYGAQIETHKQGPLNQEYLKSENNLKATTLARKIQDLPVAQIKDAIAKESNPFVAEMAEKKAADHSRYMEAMTKQKESQNYRVAFTQADALLKADPATTWSMAQTDPKIQSSLGSTTPSQRRALEAMFNPPKVSDQGAIAAAQNFMAGHDEKYPDITKAPTEYIAMLKTKLNTTDRNKIDSTIMKIVDPTNGALLAQHQDLMRLVQQKAIASGIIPVDAAQGGKIVPGTEAYKRLGDIQSKFTEATKNMGNLTADQRDAETGKFIHTLIKGDPTYGQNYEAPKKMQAYGPAFGTTAPPAGAPKTEKQIRTKAIGLWQQNPANKGIPSGPVLKKFIQDHPEVSK